MATKHVVLFQSFDKIYENIINEAADEKVRAIQAALKNAAGGKYSSLLGTSGPNKDGVDGMYGPNTIAAIKAFQADNNIQQTGFVGPKTAPVLGVQPMDAAKRPPAKTAQPQTPQGVTGNLIKPVEPARADTFEPYGAQQQQIKQRADFLLREIKPLTDQANAANAQVKIQPEEVEHGTWFSKFIKGSMKSLPLHIRAMIYYLSGRTNEMHSDELTKEEQDYLYNAANSYGIKQGFDYPVWKKLGAAGLPTAISQQGIKAETERLKQNPGNQNLASPNLAGQFMYTLGAVSKGNIKKDANGTITIHDNYDMNVVEGGQTKEDVFKGIGQTFKLWTAGEATLYSLLRKTISMRELFGYAGYPITFVLPAPQGQPTQQVAQTKTAQPRKTE